MYSHNESSNGMLVKKGSKQSPAPKDVTGLLAALPSVEVCRKPTQAAELTAAKT